MRWLISFGRVFKAGVFNFARNLWLSMAATAIMVVTLAVIIGTIAVNKATSDTLNTIAKEITVSVFLFDDITEEQLADLERKIRGSTDVKNVEYISKEDAQAIYFERQAGDEQLLDVFNIVDNSLPASFEIELFDLSENEDLVAITEDPAFEQVIEELDFERLDAVNKIGNAQRFVTRAGVFAGVLFGVISILVIFNTIRMAIFTRSTEIQIMKLIGATNNYIRGPFLVEAAMYGVISAVITLLAMYPVLTRLAPTLDAHILFTPTAELMKDNIALISLMTVSVGVVIGVISSLLAMSRHLKLHS